jgi:hypothetical protein
MMEKPFRDVIRDNTMINPSGRENHWIGVDMEMEHHVRFIQVFFFFSFFLL